MNNLARALPALETKSADNDNNPAVEVKAALDALTAEVKAKAEADKKLGERIDQIEQKLNRPNINKGAANDNKEPTDEQKSFGTYLRRGDSAADEVKVLTLSDDSGAGYLAPIEMSAEFVRNLVEYSPIRRYASVRTTSASEVRYGKRNGVTNAKWEGEVEDSEASEPSFGQIAVPVHKVTTFVDISEELLADAASAEQEVRLALAEDFGQKEAIAFVNGTGVKQPEGIMQNSGILSTVNGSASAISPDKLIDLLYSLPASYRNAPGAAWGMNGTTLAAVRKLKDGQQNFLWQPSYQAGQPETLLGKPVVEMVDMPDIGDGNFPIIFGDWSAYRILDRLNLAILVDPYTQKQRGVVRMHGTRRVGGRVLQAARFRKLKTATS